MAVDMVARSIPSAPPKPPVPVQGPRQCIIRCIQRCVVEGEVATRPRQVRLHNMIRTFHKTWEVFPLKEGSP